MKPAIELRHLRYFLAVAETSNFTRAAERLHVSQPSISQQIKDLEEELGASLFDRLGKRVRLTQAGEAFRVHAEVVLKKLDEAFNSIEQIEGLLAGHLEVGTYPAVNVPWVPRVIEKFATEYPGVSIAVHEYKSGEMETDLESGLLDLGMGLLSYESPNLTYEKLRTEELALLVSQQHPLVHRDEVTVRELESERLIMLPESFPLRQAADELFRRAKLRPRIGFEVSTIDSLLSAVGRTKLGTVLPAIVLENRKGLGLRAVKIAGRNTKIELGLVWPQRSEHGRAARAFVEELYRVSAES